MTFDTSQLSTRPYVEVNRVLSASNFQPLTAASNSLRFWKDLTAEQLGIISNGSSDHGGSIFLSFGGTCPADSQNAYLSDGTRTSPEEEYLGVMQFSWF